MTISIPKALSWVGMIVAGVALVLIIAGLGGGSNYTVYARFTDAAGLLPNFTVKIDGIKAGIVKDVTLNKAESQVIVKMQLDSSAAPIGTGASAYVRPVNLLGEKYVDLVPGDLTHPVPSGTTIPITRTGHPVELDDVFNTLDPNTRAGLGLVINEAGLAMAGQGANFMQTLRDLPPTLGQARQVVGEVASENAQLEQAIVNGNQDLLAVNSHKTDLQSLIVAGQQALRSINTARTQLGQTVDSAPGGLAQLRSSLAQLQQSAVALTPAAADLQRTTPSLAATLERLPTFVTDANGALNEARQVSPLLARLGTQSAPILSQMRPATATLASFATKFKPFLGTLDQQAGLKWFYGFIAGWTGVTSSRDGIGHLFRLRLSLDDQSITSALGKYASLFGIKIPARAQTTPLRPTNYAGSLPSPQAPATSQAPAPTAKPTGLAGLGAVLKTVLAPTTHKLGGLVNGVTGAVGRTLSGVGALLHGPGSGSGSGGGLGSLLSGALGKLLGTSSNASSNTSPSSTGAVTARLLRFLLGA
jgi:phospholipid/cholesterol/gamma-HCH transport system substrate-binding protein